MRRSFAVVALVAIAVILLPACSDGSALTIYSGRDEALVGPLLEEFAETEGIQIDIRYGDSTDLALLISEEGENSPADIFFSQSPGAVGFLDEEGRLAGLESDLLDVVPREFRADDGRWLGITARQRVLVYNQDLVKEADLPRSVFDLTDRSYRGRVGLAPTNASFQDFVSVMRSQYGDDDTLAWLEAMVANDSPTYADNNSIVDAVSRGEIPLGLVNHYYNLRFLEDDPSLPSRNYNFPGSDIGSLLIPSTVSVLETTDQPDLARSFVHYLIEREQQRYFAEETFEYPLVEGVEPAAELIPLDEVERPEVDIDELGTVLKRTAELIAESGLL
jgi:iron(III) transport system substrate-binding protein